MPYLNMSQFTMYKVKHNVTSRCIMSDCSIRQRFFVLLQNTAQIPHSVLLICSDNFYSAPSVVFHFIFNRIIAPICPFSLWFLPSWGCSSTSSLPPCPDMLWSRVQRAAVRLFCHTTKHKLVCVHWQWVCGGWCLTALTEFALWNCIWTRSKQIKKTSTVAHVSTVRNN